MTAAIVILGIAVLTLLVLTIILFVMLSSANRKIDELLKRITQSDLLVYGDMQKELDLKVEEQKQTISESLKKYAELCATLKSTAGMISDPKEIAKELNKLFGS